MIFIFFSLKFQYLKLILKYITLACFFNYSILIKYNITRRYRWKIPKYIVLCHIFYLDNKYNIEINMSKKKKNKKKTWYL